MKAPEIISDLVERFDRNIHSYKSGDYNETQVRIEFIDPFFEALGWDVANRLGYSELYKDVIHEYSLKTYSGMHAPDYGFRIGEKLKFFVEAKRPGIYIKEDISPAYQLRRYAWSAKLPLSILTDFEEFAVYDCRMLPKNTDKASTARIKFYSYKDYIDNWEEISGTFSKEAVLKGSFDKYAETNKGKRGTTEVDATFLRTIEDWREILARNIALRNSSLSTRELNFAVQKTIDRIIFLRICEDRGIEDYGQLMAMLNGEQVYKRLCQLFKRADEKYNSGLFHFDDEKNRYEIADELTLNLSIDDKVIKDIVKNLYYPESPFEFSVLPADILGQVYEQFLGKVIRLTDGHRAIVDDKPEVKKAGGVYYTPTYIVDYIVKNTLGNLLADVGRSEALHKQKDPSIAKGGLETPKQISNLKILDPACGSGSFLLGAYTYLLDWHLKYYAAQSEASLKQKDTPIYKAASGEWRLTTSEKKRILLNNIYGVDIDPQAVEVTKLSLLLKVLEGENEQTISSQLKMFKQRALPDLGSNIKCGNSLIGPDFYDQMEFNFLSDEEKLRINVFDWNTEFKDIMSNGGFDVVIGNPPYVRQELISEYKSYFENNYKVFHGVADLYSYFIEKAVCLLKENGYFSYIVSNKWMRANYGKPLRDWLKEQNLIEVVDFGDLPVFKRATTYPCVITINKEKPVGKFNAAEIKSLDFLNLRETVDQNKSEIKTSNLSSAGWSLADNKKSELLRKLFKQGIPLAEYVNGKIFRGVLTGLNKAFVVDEGTKQRLISEDPKSAEIIKPFLAGRDIKRYAPLNSDKYLIFTRRGINIKEYPGIESYLKKFKIDLTPKPKDFTGKTLSGRKPGSYAWYEIQDSIDYFREFEKPKIIIPAIEKKANYAFDIKGFYSNDKTTIIPTDNLYLIGLLNSKLLDYTLHSIASTKQGGYYEYKPMYVSRLPIVKAPQSGYVKIEDNVKSIIELNLKLYTNRNPNEIHTLKREKAFLEQRIDKLVYQVYELTEEEIKIVEGE